MKMFYYFIDPWHVIDEQKIVHGCSTFNVVIIRFSYFLSHLQDVMTSCSIKWD